MNTGRFQRMYGIPEDEYQHLRSLQQTRDPIEKKFVDLSSEYKQQGTISNPNVRVLQQAETLNEMMNLKDDLRNRLLSATPKLYQSRANSLFQFLLDKINVNNRGEIKNSDGSIIAGSNVSDLVQHAVRDRRRNIIPSGWNKFLNVLRENNVPRMILNYDTLEELRPSGKKSSKAGAPSKIPIRQIPLIKKEFTSPKLPTVTPSSPSLPRKKRTHTKPDYFVTKESGIKHAKYI